MQKIATTAAPAAIGPYSQAIAYNGLLYCSGQIAICPESGKLAAGGIAEQSAQVMRNIEAVLTAAGASFAKVIKTTCYLTDMADFAAFNEVYAQYFISLPARSCVAVSQLPKGALVEVEVLAALD